VVDVDAGEAREGRSDQTPSQESLRRPRRSDGEQEAEDCHGGEFRRLWPGRGPGHRRCWSFAVCASVRVDYFCIHTSWLIDSKDLRHGEVELTCKSSGCGRSWSTANRFRDRGSESERRVVSQGPRDRSFGAGRFGKHNGGDIAWNRTSGRKRKHRMMMIDGDKTKRKQKNRPSFCCRLRRQRQPVAGEDCRRPRTRGLARRSSGTSLKAQEDVIEVK
jgi:hypothetical protein